MNCIAQGKDNLCYSSQILRMSLPCPVQSTDRTKKKEKKKKELGAVLHQIFPNRVTNCNDQVAKMDNNTVAMGLQQK